MGVNLTGTQELLDIFVAELHVDVTGPTANRVEADPPMGEVFTRQWIVSLILDLCNYTAERDLTKLTLVEPSVGHGAFLGQVLDRLLAAKEKYAASDSWLSLSTSLIAMDLQEDNVSRARKLVVERLARAGCPSSAANQLAGGWVRRGDFLLTSWPSRCADVVVGNPPYIRIEDLPPHLLRRYRNACSTMGGRSDIYVGFYERGLDLLKAEGRLAYICADRWMRNQYGRKLRGKVVSDGFAVDVCMVMHDVRAFENDVSAYPAVTVIRRGTQREAIVGDASVDFGETSAATFVQWVRSATSDPLQEGTVQAARLPHWHNTDASWPDASPAAIRWLEDLSDSFPLLEDPGTQTRIGIGVATGADSVYVTTDGSMVESARLLPLAMASDLKTGKYTWTGHYLVNPWDSAGLIDIDDWPEFKNYMIEKSQQVNRRSIAKRTPDRWYRTIDRVDFSLTSKPKLLMEDMKARPHPVMEPGGHYPHHNLYFIVSDGWNLEILGGLLLSDVVMKQVSAYCVKMRGGTLRFQAQYLRRVRVPRLIDVPADVQNALAEAFRSRDRVAATSAALAAYGMDHLPV